MSTEGSVFYNARAIGIIGFPFKILYKREGLSLSVYIYCYIPRGSSLPFISMSSDTIEFIGEFDDISEYEEMNITT